MIQLPALNTPQFNWVKSRLPRRGQPVPPIYQPEVAADAIVWASTHYRREWYVGLSTNLAIIGNKISPQFVDWHLNRKGYDIQQYNGPEDKDRPNNLYDSVSGNFSAHGDFDQRSRTRSLQLYLSRCRWWIVGILALISILFSLSL